VYICNDDEAVSEENEVIKGQYCYSPCYEATFYIGLTPEGLRKCQMDFYGNKFLALTRTASTFELQSQNSADLFSHVQTSCLLFYFNCKKKYAGLPGIGKLLAACVCRDSVKICTILVSNTRIIGTRIVHVARIGRGEVHTGEA
jgi:hypothetical protein